MRLSRPRRALGAASATAALALTLTACGGSATLPAASGSSGSAAADASKTYDEILAAAPVASADQIPAGSLMAKIKKRGTLIVGGTDTSALFSLKDPVTGELTGFDAGLAAMLAKYITGKTSTKLVQVSVATREQLLRNGTVDTVFATYSITPERAKKVDFAGPYYSSGDAILVKKANTGITSVDDLNGRTVCTQSGSTAANDIKDFAPKSKVILFDGNSQCVQAVKQGRADAYVIDQAILVGTQYRDPSVKVVGQPFTTDPYGIGTPKADPEMKTFVDAWLKKIEASGAWAKLWKATLGTAVTGAAPKPPVIGSVEGS
ncbi:glutamate ABC transporter substrate-binding protein [Streptomyces prunicolor]|uniref:glutamate ABC transporter substrate-binding protein n=1 Tax=Streptomyces prunicolor TaxID=67348 RepID=UPI00341BC33C